MSLDTTNRHTISQEETSFLDKELGTRTAERNIIGLPQEEFPNYSIPSGQPRNHTHTSNTNRLRRFCLYMYVLKNTQRKRGYELRRSGE